MKVEENNQSVEDLLKSLRKTLAERSENKDEILDLGAPVEVNNQKMQQQIGQIKRGNGEMSLIFGQYVEDLLAREINTFMRNSGESILKESFQKQIVNFSNNDIIVEELKKLLKIEVEKRISEFSKILKEVVEQRVAQMIKTS